MSREWGWGLAEMKTQREIKSYRKEETKIEKILYHDLVEIKKPNANNSFDIFICGPSTLVLL